VTDEARIRQQAVAGILRGVATKTVLIDFVAVAAALIYYTLTQRSGQTWWYLPVSIIFGSLLGILNFRWLALAVERFYLRKGATPGFSSIGALILNFLKLSVIFFILFIVIKWQLMHVFGIVGGLSICFLAIVWEGATIMKQTLPKG